MNYARQFAWHAAMTVAATVVTGTMFYALRIVLYKGLPQDDYGLFYVLFSYATVIQTVITFGFDPGLVPYVTRFREENDPDAIKSLALGALLPQAALLTAAVATILVAVPLAGPWIASHPGAPAALEALNGPVAKALFPLLALHAVFVVLFKCGQQVLLGVQAIAWRNAGDLFRAVLCLGGAMLLLERGWGVRATAAAYTLGALAEVVVLGLALAVSHRNLLRARSTWRPELVRSAFDTGKWLSVAFGGIVVFSSIDTVVISLVRADLADAAAYQIALPTINILYSLLLAAGVSLLPTVRTLWVRGEHTLLANGVHRLYGAAIAVMLPTGVLLAFGSDVLMTTLFGPNIRNAADAFDVLAIGGVAFFLAYINLHVLAGIDQPRAAGVAVAGGLVIDVLLSVPLTYTYGIRGSAIAGTCAYAVAAAIGLAAIRRRLTVRFPVRASVGAVALSFAIALAAGALRHWGVIAVGRPGASAVAGGIVLGVGFVLLEFIGFINLRKLLSRTDAVPQSHPGPDNSRAE